MTSESELSDEDGGDNTPGTAAVSQTKKIPVFCEFSPGWDPLALLRYIGVRNNVAQKIVDEYVSWPFSPPTIPTILMDYFEAEIERYRKLQAENFLDIALLEILEEKTARNVASLVCFGLEPPMSESVLYWLQCWVDAVCQMGYSCKWMGDVPSSGTIETMHFENTSVRVLNIRLGCSDPKLDLSLYDPKEFGNPNLFHSSQSHEHLESLVSFLRPTGGRRDFGVGFYLQDSFDGAVFWALKRAAVSQTTGTVAVLVLLYHAEIDEIAGACRECPYYDQDLGMKTFSSSMEQRDEVTAWHEAEYPRYPADDYCIVSGVSGQTSRRQIAVKHEKGCGYLRTRCTGVVRIFVDVDQLHDIIEHFRVLF